MTSESIRVLLVEDNMGDADLILEGLAEALPGQFQLTHARRLSEALEYLWKETCDVVLLDLGLPDSHGIDTLVLTRAQSPRVPIVVLTGFQDETLGDQALKEGAQDYLVKGQVDSKLLARSLRYAIARKAVAEGLIWRGSALAKADELRLSRLRLIAAHERMRRETSGALNSCVQKRLMVLVGHLQGLQKGIRPDSEKARMLGYVIDALEHEIEQQVGILSRQLYPTNLSEGLLKAFQSFRERFGSDLAVEIEPDEALLKREQADCQWLPEELALVAYRIAEEALTNVFKNAQASKVAIGLDSSRDGWLRLTVRDDGQRLGEESSPCGLGRGTMQDYAEAVDGECSVHRDPGKGTEVTALLPISRPNPENLESSETGDH